MSRPIGGDLSGYYRLHAPIYDLTRPFFLFGRRALVRRLALHWRNHGGQHHVPRILEVGCGTGSNLALMAKLLPRADLVGVDLALPMLERARRRLGARATLVHGALGEVPLHGPFDLVIASYMLSMCADAVRPCIRAITAQLAPDGVLGVVDFERSGSATFARWMGLNHVRMDGTLVGLLDAEMARQELRSRRAFGGAWRYGQWLGRAREDAARDPGADF